MTKEVRFEPNGAQASKAPPLALQLTKPAPVPPFGRIVMVAGGGAAANVAVIVESTFNVTTQGAVPAHAALPVPALQPVKPVLLAVKVTTVSVGKTTMQRPVAHVMPDGLDVTVPLFTNVTARVLKEALKWAVAVASETSVSPGKEVAKFAAEKSSVAGKPAGAVAGSTMGLPAAGSPPARVNNSCARLITLGSDRLVALKTDNAVTTELAGTAAPMERP
jgi:hypothetical protein